MRPSDFQAIGTYSDAIYRDIVARSPKLQRGQVWCRRCQRLTTIDPVQALRSGWPLCCGASMTLDSPAEQRADALSAGGHP